MLMQLDNASEIPVTLMPEQEALGKTEILRQDDQAVQVILTEAVVTEAAEEEQL